MCITSQKDDILSYDKQSLVRALSERGLINNRKGEPSLYKATQVYDWLHGKRVTDFAQMTNVSAGLRVKLGEHYRIGGLTRLAELKSVDGTVKYLYKAGNATFETVLMRYHHGNTVCISTQSGCRMGCRFCASAHAGFTRDLTPSEMLLQVYESERGAGVRVSNVVLMGIGEPFDNFGNVVTFLRILSENGFGMRHVSVSTCGVVPRIYDFADLGLQSTLSVSLHAVTDEARDAIMPINRQYNIAALLQACDYFFEKTGRRVSYEFALIDGVNDDDTAASELARLLSGMAAQRGVVHVNLIPVNPLAESHGGLVYAKSRRVAQFRDVLMKKGITATIRRTLGGDINAACGQLRVAAL
ncbi:23S rRNA (adenine(2503)-C(2))-methyltransferase RlmN [Clostridia bacterium]|nr:23S rRNA (adenine(2503)-C(2))-methyltransferase RlmN [Clostridia bacterium]